MKFIESMRINLFPNKREIGNTFEELACEYLKKKGHSIIARNFAARDGEIDIVSYDKKKNCIVFVEVKYRTGKDYGLPQEAVTKEKQKRIIKAAYMFIKKKNVKAESYRFDVISVSVGNRIEHIENAFMVE